MTIHAKNAHGPSLLSLLLLLAVLFADGALAHEGPDPAAQWVFDRQQVEGDAVRAVLGPAGVIEGKAEVEKLGQDGALVFNGSDTAVRIDAEREVRESVLPTRAFTVSAVVSVDRPQRWGGIVGMFQDNGGAERGWILGYNHRHFTIGLSTQGADDGNGRMTYLAGETAYEAGRLYHVAAVYDGKTLELYVNGKREASTREQSGDILYPDKAPMMIGTYRDDDENNLLTGRISRVSIYHDAAARKWIEHDYDHAKKLLAMDVQPVQPTVDPTDEHQLVVQPFLQFATTDGITVTWETSQPARSTIHWGPTQACEQRINLEGTGQFSEQGFVQQGRVAELEPHTQYFYRVESVDALKRKVQSDVFTFQTAPDRDTPFAFAAISDTQGNYEVASQISKLAWGHRPSFLLHPGDLVQTGRDKRHWTRTFFPSMHPLISRVPIFPVLGNHEQDAAFYYHYMDLPKPEYYYTFTYGNAQFFIIDTNRNVDPESEQYQWLDQALSQSDATWKIVCHHHPPYSSDENDYGNLWKTNESSRGDKRVRQLVTLYDKHAVDVVWTGHIHSYERTWPLKESRPVDEGGTLYMITGGGGGSLERPGPFRPAFQNVVQRGHHFSMIHVNGRIMEVRVFTDRGELFDTFVLDKRE